MVFKEMVHVTERRLKNEHPEGCGGFLGYTEYIHNIYIYLFRERERLYNKGNYTFLYN